ncbi:hypothetical protein HA466_0309650 [Hirschfeldia incana]|nr:hypothetical protein HA466_0309650 [Hirschfeldia incana]
MSSAGGRGGSKGLMKRITSTFSIKRNQNTTTTTNDPKPVFPRSRSTGASYESMRLRQGKKALPDVTAKTKRTKSACVSPQRRREKLDESRKQIEDIDSIWLTSDSSSSLFGERKVSVSFHFSLDESIVSWLSNASKNQEDTKENHHHHHHHHQKSSKDAKKSSENIQKDGKSAARPCSSRLPENNNKTCEETSSFNRYVSPELTSQSHEEKKVTFSLESDVSPSPVISTLGPPSTPPIAILASALEKVAEIGGSKRRNVVEPLFWPLDQKFDWTTDDIMKHFSMSPQRKKYIGSKSASTSPRSMRAQLHTRKLDLKEGCKRKLMFNGRPGSNSKLTQIPELKQTITINQPTIKKGLKRNKSLPSRLRNSSDTSSKVVPIEATEESVEISREEKTPRKLVMTRKSRTLVEDDFALMNDFSIENAVGLCEFRGREGIDSDFNTDCFLFEDSI